MHITLDRQKAKYGRFRMYGEMANQLRWVVQGMNLSMFSVSKVKDGSHVY